MIIDNKTKNEAKERIEIENILSVKNFGFYYFVVEGGLTTLETITRAFDQNVQILIFPVSIIWTRYIFYSC